MHLLEVKAAEVKSWLNICLLQSFSSVRTRVDKMFYKNVYYFIKYIIKYVRGH